MFGFQLPFIPVNGNKTWKCKIIPQERPAAPNISKRMIPILQLCIYVLYQIRAQWELWRINKIWKILLLLCRFMKQVFLSDIYIQCGVSACKCESNNALFLSCVGATTGWKFVWMLANVCVCILVFSFNNSQLAMSWRHTRRRVHDHWKSLSTQGRQPLQIVGDIFEQKSAKSYMTN